MEGRRRALPYGGGFHAKPGSYGSPYFGGFDRYGYDGRWSYDRSRGSPRRFSGRPSEPRREKWSQERLRQHWEEMLRRKQ
jgi:hypothetical protein